METKKYIKNIPESFRKFAKEVQSNSVTPPHSMYVVGSVLTPDYVPGGSDINSLIVIEEHQLDFLDFLILMGKEFKQHVIAPPLVMTAEYIDHSLDVFPIEFFNFQAIHHTLFGEDLLDRLQIADQHLRLQCEREIKAKLLWLGQVYIETLGDRNMLSEKLAASITGYFPLFRAIIHLAGRDVPLGCSEVLQTLNETLSLETDIFKRIHQMKISGQQPAQQGELCSCFSSYYQATQHVAGYVDQLSC
ncbi:MAG: hypothetical protein L3J49_10500 [Desulfobulbaceae bacterium]|nr:hypothetical protein [Desulfobulbaceae bacterium]